LSARRCDHSPARPRLEPSKRPSPNAPAIAADIWERLAHLYHRTGRFPELTGRALAGPLARLRSRRSSRREAWALVLRALGARWDRRTNRCGVPRGDRDDTADCPSIADLIEETGCSRGRVVRALRDFHEAGYLKSHRLVMAYADGNRYCGLPSVRVLQPALFRRLGISDRKRERAQLQAAAKWRAQRAPAASAPGMQKVRRELRSVRQARYQAPPPAPVAARPEPGLEAQLARLARVYGEPPPSKR
jgi:hypothetical protein